MNNRISPFEGQAATPLDTLLWGERNLSALATLSASRLNGGGNDLVHLSAVFSLLRARQAIRSGRVEQERLARQVAR